MKQSRRTFLRQTAAFGVLLCIRPIVFSSSKQTLPNVLIIGDSISIGYTPHVKELLTGIANVTRPDENCSGTTKGVTKIEEWLGSVKWDVIHFNFGLHDLKHVHPETGQNSANPNHPLQADIKQYTKNLNFIIKQMKATGAQLIFATTTPVPDKTSNPLREPGIELKYNKAASKLAKKHKFMVNDLHSFSLPIINEIQLQDNVHFTPEGYRVLGKKVSDSILKVLENR